jgi:formate dehydrogenase alpha subunit
MSNNIKDVYENAQSIFLIGSNTSEAHPVVATMIRRAVRKRGLKLIVVDPRRIEMVDFATMHMRNKPGTDIALVNGLMNIILEKGWEDQDYITERCEGFDEFKQKVLQYTPERVSKITGVPVSQLYQAAEIMHSAKPLAVAWTLGITQHYFGVHNVMTLANLQMLLGNVGIPGGGVNPLRGQNNVQGACDMGGLPNVYSGYQAVVNEDVQKKFEGVWGATSDLKIGLTLTEMIPGIPEGKIKALFVVGEDPATSDPDTRHIHRCLSEVDFLVVQDIFPTDTAKFADILLPGASFAEKTGTFTNTERRIQMVREAIKPLGDSKPDWQITTDIARRLIAEGIRDIKDAPAKNWDYQNSSEIMDEIASVTPSFRGVNHQRLENGESLQWPVPSIDHPGTPILHTKGFARGKGKFTPIDHSPSPEAPNDEYPMILNTGRVLYHWHGGQMTRRAKGLLEVYNNALIEINPEDAEKLHISGDKIVRVTSRRGSIEAEAWITLRVPPGMVYANFHFPESSANELTLATLDFISKIPSYKVCAVKVEWVR